MKESAIKKTSIAIIFFTALTALALYIDVPGKFRTPEASDASGDALVSFLDGAVLQWIIPNNPGGGYDEYARLVAPYIEKYSGARVRLRNIPGSGGMRAMGELFKSPGDGLTISIINGTGMVTSQIADISNSDYQIGELSYLARIATDTRVLILSMQSPHRSFADILNAEVPLKIGATGFGGSTFVDAVVSRDLLGLNVNVIHGFNNSAAMRQALLRGSIDGTWSSWGSVIDQVTSGHARIVLQGGRTRTAALPEVPAIFEFLDKVADREPARDILNAWLALHAVGRCVAAPPGIPAEKLRILREVFRQALNDPRFLDDAAKARRTVNYAPGEQMELLVTETLEMPAEIRQFFINAVRSELQ
ncbi:MAG: tripartite tricarboxylate transporter substrate-binding protein [Lysobacterales bacterium]